MNEKETKATMRRMNKQEFQFNKPLLREINQKRKGTAGGDSETY